MILFGEIGCFLRGKVQLHGREDVTKVVTKLLCKRKGFPGGSRVENLPANGGDAGDPGSIPGSEDPLEEKMAIHSSLLASETPWTEKPGGLRSMSSRRVRYD